MINNHPSAFRLVTLLFTLLGAFSFTSLPLEAAVFYWDADGSATNDNVVLGTNLGGTGTWDASAQFWYSSVTSSDTAWPNLLTDTAIFNGTAGTVTITPGGINTGALQFLATGYTLGGGQLTLGGTGNNLFVASTFSATMNSVIAGSNGLGLYGPGTLNLSAVNQYTGSTTLSNGATLNLDFTTNATNLIQSSSGLVLNNGTLKLSGVNGATDSQTFASTSVTGGGVITLAQNGANPLTVALGTITQSLGGSLNFSVVPLTSGVVATTSNGNVSGILGPWATVGTGTAVSYATVNGSNQIVAYTGGTTAATGAALTDTTGSVNYNLSAAAGTVQATFSGNTIRYTGAAATTAPGATGFTVNGLINSGTGLWTIGTNNITIGANKELEIITGTNGITITSVIKDNAGGASSLTYSGTGTLTLSKANLYTGTTTINSGTLNLGLAAALNSASSLVVNGGTFGEVTFADTVTGVSLRNGSITGTTGVLTSTTAFDLQSGTISAPMGGTAGLNKTTPGTVTLTPTTAGTLTGSINIKAGTLVMNGTLVVSFAAANTINLGDATGSADARLAVSSTNATYANPIVLSSGTTGNLSIGNQGTTAITFSNANTVTGTNNLIISNTSTGGLTLANVANTGTVTNGGSGAGTTTISALGAGVTALSQIGTSPLTLTPAWLVSQLGATITSSGTGLFTLTGGVSGGTNLVFNTNSTGGITVASTTNTGTITASGTGTGTTTLTTIGAGVTSLNLTGTGGLALSPAWLTTQLGSTITNNGAGLLTLTGGITGGTNLVFNATSTGGITVTAATTSSGTITNSGSGTGNVTLTAALPATITDVVQNGGGTLTLTSGANAYTGNTIISSGILSFAGTPVVTTSSGLGNSLSNIVLGSASTSGTLVYTGAALTLSRNFTINAGGGEIDSTTAALTINPGGVLTSSNLTINPGGNLTFGGANNIVLGGTTANVALISGTNTLTKVGAGTLTLSTIGGAAAIQSVMPININAGTLTVLTTAVATVNPLGTGAITITPGGTLSFSNGGAIFTLPNTITIANAAGTATLITSGTVNSSGAITFAAGANIPTLKLSNTSSTAFSLNVSGAVSGIGNIQLNPSNTGSTITLSGPQNETGTISNVGSSTQLATLSGTIGSGISAISQAGANPFTVTSVVPLSAGLNTFTSTGAGLWTFSGGFTGTQPLTFNANSSGNITISTTLGTFSGTLTNSGTGGGVTTITANIGSNITNVLQTSANAQLLISGTANTYSGTAIVSAGILDFTTTLAIPGYSTSPAAAFSSGKISVASGATLVLPYGGSGAITTADFANLSNGTYSALAPGASLGLDTTNAIVPITLLSFVLADGGGSIGALNFTKSGTNTLSIGSANTYTGTTSIVNGTLLASTINSVNGGTPLFAASSLGAPATVANGTINLGFGNTTGTLSYIGTGETTDRVFNLAGNSGGGVIDNSGTGLLTLTSPMTFTGTGAKTLTLSGTSNIAFSSAIAGNASTGAAPLTISKTGANTVTLSGANSATSLIISGGILDTGAGGISLANAGLSNVSATGTGTINGKIFLGATNAAGNGPDYTASAGAILTLNAVIANGASSLQNIDFGPAAGGTVILAGANTFTGQVQINGAGIVQVSSINSVTGGVASSSLGVPSSAANGTILLNTGGTLKYTGNGETTDRIISLSGTTAGGTIDQSGAGLLKFTSAFATPGAGPKTFILQGSSTGTGEIAGAITQNSATNSTTVTKAGTGTWMLSGVNTYTGATNVNGGNLILSQGAGTGTLNNTAITINSGGTLSPLGGTAGYTVGNSATALLGGKLTLNGGTLNMADGVINPLILVQNATFVGNAAVFSGGALNFDLGTSTADMIDVRLGGTPGTGLATSSGSNGISISVPVGTASLTPNNYTLINSAVASTLSNSNFYLASQNLNVGGTLYLLTLSGTTGTEVLTVAVNGGAAVTPNTAYWNGTTNASWAYQPGGNGTATNWSASANSTPDTFAPPGSVTNVSFTTNNATNLSTTLDQSFTINSLTFTGTNTADSAGSTIASGTGVNTLTINAAALSGNTLGNGITVNAGAGASLISAGVILGSSQTWTSNATNTLTLSGVISDGGSIFNLSTAGTGTLFFSSAANTYSGVTTVGAGSSLKVSTLANGGVLSSIGTSSNAAANLVLNGTLLYAGGTISIDRAFTLPTGAASGIGVAGSSVLTLPGATGAVTTGSLTKSDIGTLVLTGAQTYTGNTVVAGGTLNLSGTASLTGLPASSKLSLTPTAGNTSVVNYTSSATSTLFAVTGATVAGTSSAFYQTAGTINLTPGTGSGTQNVAGGVGAYGFYGISGGVFRDTTGTAGATRFTVSNSGGTAPIISGTTGAGIVTAVLNVSGTGLIDHTNAEWWLSYGLGEITVTDSGKIDHTGSAQAFAIFMDSTVTAGSYGVLNLAGTGAQVLTGNTGGLRFGNSTTNGTGNSGFVNLAAGTLSTGVNSAYSLNAIGGNGIYFNYAGGTLKATASLTQFAPTSSAAATVISTIYGAVNNNAGALTGSGAPSFTGGLTIDTNTFTVTVPTAMPLLGATGFQVTQADLTVSGGSGYIGAPAVIFSKPASATGVPASGYALMSGGSVVGIVITDPGVYASGETPVVTLVGGGATVAATVTSGALATANSSTGGLTKINAGNLLITGTGNTFGGPVDIKGGTLTVTSITNGSAAAGTLGISSSAASNLLLDGGTLSYTGTVAGITDRSFTLAASNSALDASGTTAGTFTLTSTSAIAVSSGLGAANLILQGTGTGVAGAGSLAALIPDGTGTTVSLIKNGTGTWSLTSSASTYSGATTINGGILSVVALSAGGSASSIGASSNAAANLVLSGGTLLYTGSGSTTDRNYTFGNATTASGFTLDSEGTGALVITGGMTGVNTAVNTQILSLVAGAASGSNTISGVADSNTGLGALTGVTKTGAGTWVISGSSSYTGATTLTAGTLQFAGSSALQGATQISMAAGTTLQVRDDATTITHTASNITVTSAGTVTLDVGNNGGATTGQTVAFGALNNGTAANAFATTFNFTGANGYLQSYSSLALAGLTSATTTLNPTTTSVTITGNVTSQQTTAAAHSDTLALDGTSTGNSINGVISDSLVFTSVGNGDTRVTKQNTSTWTLGGASTYNGPTVINGGTLALSSTGSLGNTAITVANGAVFAPTPGSGTTTVGSTGAGTLGATLNISANGTLSMVDGGIGIFFLNTNTSFAGAALTLTSANLNLDLSSAGVDQIKVAGNAVASAITGTNTVSFTGVGSSLTPGTYSFLTAQGITAGNSLFKFDNGTTNTTLTVGLLSYQLNLTSIAGVEQLVVGTGVGSLTWTGQTNGTGAANSVWTATPSGNNNFADLSPAVADYSDGSAVTFQDRNLISGTNVTNGLVTIAAAGVNPSAVTVNNSAVNYTFQNAGGTVGIAGSASLTKNGTGTLTLLGQNTYTGPTSINAGIVNLGVAEGAGFGPLGTGGLISFGGGTLQFSAANQADYSARFSTAANEIVIIDTNGQNVAFATGLASAGGTLTKNGAGKLTLNGISTSTGNTTVNAGTLSITGASGALGAMASPIITVNAGAVLDLTNTDTLGSTANRNALVINGGTVQNNATGKRDTLINTVTMTGGLLSGTSLGDASSGAFSLDNSTTSVIATSDAAGNAATISANLSTQLAAVFQVNRGSAVAAGAPDLIISGAITPFGAGTNGVTFKGNGITTLSGANTYTGTTTVASGTLIIGATNTIKTTDQLTFGTAGSASVGALQLNAFSQTLGTILVTSNGATPNTISIASGQTLTTGTLTMGYDSLAVVGITNSNLTVSGGGAFAISGATTVNVSTNQAAVNSSTTYNQAVLDVTGVASFTAAVTTFNIGVGSGTTGNGTVLLSNTANTITATTLQVGNSGGNNANGTSLLQFGTGTNVINATTINLGYSKSNANVGFATHTAGSPGTLTIAGTSGGTSTSNITIASNNGTGTGAIDTVVFDVTGHVVNIQAGTLQIGNGSNAATGGATGTLSFDAGTVSALNVSLGLKSGTAGTGAGTGTLNIGGGTFTVKTGGSVVLATNSAVTGSATATINITGSGTLSSNADITKGGGTNTTATLNLNGATALLDMSGGGASVHNIGSATVVLNAFNFTNGTLRNFGTIFGGITLAGTGERVFNETGSFSGQVNGVITGTGVGIDKTGTGTITLLGANTFTGSIDIDGGTLVANLANNSVNPTSSALGNTQVARNINVNNGGTLQLSSSDTLGGSTSTVVSTLVINAGGTVTNDATGEFNTLGAVQLNGGTLTGVKGSGNAQAQMYSLQGSVTVGGTAASTISGPAAGGSTTGGYHLAANTTFNVANATGDAQSDLVVSGVLMDQPNAVGNGGLTKSGAGTMTVTSASTYSGATTVSGGTLQVGTNATPTASIGTGSGAVTVNTGATLAGTGTVGGSSSLTTISSGAVLMPGDGTAAGSLTNGNLNIGGNLTVAAGGQIQLQIDTPTVSGSLSGFASYVQAHPGATALSYLSDPANASALSTWNAAPASGSNQYDYLNVGGTLTLGHAAHEVSVTFNSYSTVTYGDVFNLLDWTSLTGIDASTLAGGFNVATDLDLSGPGAGLAWDTSAFTHYGILLVAPEPGRSLMLLLGLTGLLLRRRRKI